MRKESGVTGLSPWAFGGVEALSHQIWCRGGRKLVISDVCGMTISAMWVMESYGLILKPKVKREIDLHVHSGTLACSERNSLSGY